MSEILIYLIVLCLGYFTFYFLRKSFKKSENLGINRNKIKRHVYKRDNKSISEQINLDVERNLLIEEEKNTSKYNNVNAHSEVNDTQNGSLLDIFYNISEDLSLKDVENLIGSKGTLTTKSGDKEVYSWTFGWYPVQIINKEQQYLKYLSFVHILLKLFITIGFFFAAYCGFMYGYNEYGYIALSSSLITSTYILGVIGQGLLLMSFCTFITSFIAYIISIKLKMLFVLFSGTESKEEEIMIRVSLKEGKVVAKEQRGLS